MITRFDDGITINSQKHNAGLTVDPFPVIFTLGWNLK